MLESRTIRDIGRMFIGRQPEIARLEAALTEALGGRSRLVMLAGEPGIGKTRTAVELTKLAEAQGARVLWGQCYEEDGAPPYWPWIQSIRSHVQNNSSAQLAEEMGLGAANIAEIVPELRIKLPDLKSPSALEPEQARFRLFDSIATFLKNSAQKQPLVLVLDDIQWADRSSLQLLQFLSRKLSLPQPGCLLVMGCYRDMDLSEGHILSETLVQLSRSAGGNFQRIVLGGLDREDTATFIEASAGFKPTAELAEALFAHTEGNPFFITEVIRLMAESGELTAGHTGTLGKLLIPEGVRDVIDQRLSRVSELCKEMLTTASIIGKVFDLRLLNDLCDGLPEGQLQQLVEEAMSFHLIEEMTGQIDQYQFSHALVQQTLARGLTAGRRSSLHAGIGEALESFYGDDAETYATELAFHFDEAQAVLGSNKLIRYSLIAGERAIDTYAHEEALPHFQRAIAQKEGQPMDPEKASILFGLGRSQLATLGRDHISEAMENLDRAFEFYADSGDVERAVAVAEQPTPTTDGHRTAVGKRMARALTMVTPDSLTAGRLLALQGRILGQETGDHDAAGDAFRRALAIAQKEDDPALELRSLANMSFLDFFLCRWRECSERTPRILGLAKKVDDPHGQLITHLAGAFVDLFTGNLAGARWHVAEGMPLAERLHDRLSMCGILARSASVAYVEGDWPSARDATDRGFAILANDSRLLNDRALLEYQVGNFDEGDAYISRLLESMRTMEPLPSIEFALIAASLPLINRIKGVPYHQDFAERAAKAVLSSGNTPILFKGIVRAGLALRAVDEGDAESAAGLYANIKPLQGGLVGGGNLTSADYLLGLLANTIGNPDQSSAHFEDALTFCRDAGYKPELAWVCCDYADTLLARGPDADQSKATSLLKESLSLSTDLGMLPLIDRVTNLLGRIQVPPPKPPTFPAGLSEREVEVLRLLASGKSNAVMASELVLSVRTVERHIANIYSKTDSHGRAEATAFAFTNGLIVSQ